MDDTRSREAFRVLQHAGPHPAVTAARSLGSHHEGSLPSTEGDQSRVILHFDCDSFYAQVIYRSVYHKAFMFKPVKLYSIDLGSPPQHISLVLQLTGARANSSLLGCYFSDYQSSYNVLQ